MRVLFAINGQAVVTKNEMLSVQADSNRHNSPVSSYMLWTSQDAAEKPHSLFDQEQFDLRTCQRPDLSLLIQL